MRFARSPEKFFFILFASNFLLPIKAKLIERILNYFRFVSLPNFVCYASFSFCFHFISFSFCFRCENKRENIFSHRSEKISLLFRFISLRSENDSSFFLPFRFISLRSENDGSSSLPFRLEAKMIAVFCFLFASVTLHFASKQK